MSRDDSSLTRLQALLDQGAAGADSAYGQLLAQAADRLQRLTHRMLRSYPHLLRWEESGDVFQSAALRLHRSLAQVKPPTVSAFWGLATTQIRRTLIDLARHHFGPEGPAAHHHSDASPAADWQPLSGECGPDTLQEWSEFHELIDRLPPAERDVFHLVWYAGLPQSDIAELLSISVATVQRRWNLAQMHVYKLLQGEKPARDEPNG